MSELPPTEPPTGKPAASDRRTPTAVAMLRLHAAPFAGALLAGILAAGGGAPAEAAALVYASLLLAGTYTSRTREWADVLPFTRGLVTALGPLLGIVLVAIEQSLIGLPGLDLIALLVVGGVASAVAVPAQRAARAQGRRRGPVRVVVIGSAAAADALRLEVEAQRGARHQVVGRVVPPTADETGPGLVPTLGRLEELGPIVAEHRIDLLLIGADVPRLAVFDEISRSCLHLPVRLQELSNFYEQIFGHVPVSEINASWFGYIVHPKYRAAPPAGKRAIDLAITVPFALVAAPLIGALALMVRRDGGPAFFRQERIGEGGRSFTIYKLRTMRVGASAAWSTTDDDRITPVGRLLRKTHLDELPQLLNVLRGEMSLVGPRPEQPTFVDKLEGTLPFYSRRHLIKPGLTGWAQVRCGYAGSDIGSAWKLCHDLYYLKHRSLRLDLAILVETVRTLVADAQYASAPVRWSLPGATRPGTGFAAPTAPAMDFHQLR